MAGTVFVEEWWEYDGNLSIYICVWGYECVSVVCISNICTVQYSTVLYMGRDNTVQRG